MNEFVRTTAFLIAKQGLKSSNARSSNARSSNARSSNARSSNNEKEGRADKDTF
jgi:hypothetical protein